MDWYRVAVSRLPIELQVSSSIDPSVPPPYHPPSHQVPTRPWFYTHAGRFVNLYPRLVTNNPVLEVVERRIMGAPRRDSITIHIDNPRRATIRGWGEFDPNHVPSLRSVITGHGVGQPPQVMVVDRQSSMSSFSTHPPSGKVLRVLLHVVGHSPVPRSSATSVFLEIEWRDGHLELVDYHTHTANSSIKYALTDHGYYRFQLVGGQLNVQFPDGQSQRFTIPSTPHYEFSNDGVVVHYEHQDRPAVLVIHRGSVFRYQPESIHTRNRYLVVDRHYLIYLQSNRELQVVNLVDGSTILTFPIPRTLEYIHTIGIAYDDLHQVLFIGTHDGLVFYRDGVINVVWHGRSAMNMAAQWLPWRQTLVSRFEGIQDPVVVQVVSRE